MTVAPYRYHPLDDLAAYALDAVDDLGERQAIIEIAPGLEMTVIKQAIVKTLKPEDDEFEYSDDAEPTDLDAPTTDSNENPHDGAFADPQGANPFDTIEPSDFNDPEPSGGEGPHSGGTGPNTQK